MYASVRRYTGMGPDAIEQILQRRGEIETVMKEVAGFQSWHLIRTDGGMITVTVCDDRAGAEASVRAAGDYVRQHMAELVPNPPEVANGEVALQIRR